MEHVPEGKKVIRVSMYAHDKKEIQEGECYIICDKVMKVSDVMAMVVAAVDAATGKASDA